MNPDLSTRYLGMNLKNPLVVASCGLTGRLDTLRALEDAGAAAVVLPPLFAEQVEHEEQAIHRMHEYHTESFGESLDFFPELDDYNTGPESYLELIRAAKKALGIPVIASVNGHSPGEWTRYAGLVAEAGADALELNVVIVPTGADLTGAQVEERLVDLVSSVREAVAIPLAVKISPFFSSIPHIAHRLLEAGADGLVVFSRSLEPDIELETLDVLPRIAPSSSKDIHLPLRWIAILHARFGGSLAAAGGFRETADILKALLAGADAVMTASALVEYGPTHLAALLRGIETWLREREYESVEQMQGSVSRLNCADPSAYERPNYLKALVSYTGKFI